MRPIENNFIVEVEDRSTLRHDDGTEILGHNGQPLLTKVHEYNYSENQNRVATLKKAPIRVTETYKSWGILKDGDKVLLHKEAFSPNHKQSNGDYHLTCDFIIAKVDGNNLIPLGDRVFLNKVENTVKQVGLIILPFATEHIPQEGVVKWASKAAKDWGITEGDVAYIQEVARAQIYFNGEYYFTVEKEMLLGKKVDDTLLPYGYYVTIFPEPEPETLIFIPVKRRSNTLKGKVINVGKATEYLNKDNQVLYFRLKQLIYGDLLIMREEFIVGTCTEWVELSSDEYKDIHFLTGKNKQ